jgi:hypothetical protein
MTTDITIKNINRNKITKYLLSKAFFCRGSSLRINLLVVASGKEVEFSPNTFILPDKGIVLLKVPMPLV